MYCTVLRQGQSYPLRFLYCTSTIASALVVSGHQQSSTASSRVHPTLSSPPKMPLLYSTVLYEYCFEFYRSSLLPLQKDRNQTNNEEFGIPLSLTLERFLLPSHTVSLLFGGYGAGCLWFFDGKNWLLPPMPHYCTYGTIKDAAAPPHSNHYYIN